MTKKVIYISLILLLQVSCYKDPDISKSQQNFHLKVFGGSSTDDCNAIRSDGENLYLTGSIDYLNGPDLFLIKTDKYGNEVEWSPKLFGAAGIDVGTDISIDRNQNIVVAGYSQAAGSQSTDIFVVKTNSMGEEIWSKHYGGRSNERAYSVNTSVPNMIFIAGYTESVDFDFRKRQGWLLALSENGDSLWSKDYGTSFVPDEIHEVTTMNDSFLLIGTTQSIFGNFKNDIFLFILKQTTKGIENSITLFKLENQAGVSALFSPPGDIYALGYTQLDNGTNNIILWKLTKDLQIVKERQIVSTISETPSALLYENGTLIIVGTGKNEQGNDDYLIYLLDSQLNTISRNTYGSVDDQKGSSGVVFDKTVIVGGCTRNGTTSKATIFKSPEILP